MEQHLFSRVNLAAGADPLPERRRAGSGGGVRALRAGDRRARAASTCRCSASAPTATSASTSRRASWRRARTASRSKASTRRSNAALFGGDAERGPDGGAVDGDGDDPPRAADRADGDGEVEGAVHRASGQRPDHDEAAGVVPAAARRRRADARRGGRVEALRAAGPVVSADVDLRGISRSSRRRGSMSSPIASRTELSALRSRFIACGSVRPVFCITIAAFTFHFARLSSASAAS